ncbi:MAG: S24 family peptidase, partial [Kiloniellales bacterium]|nr:S24 family peptidase [Kiloniellales bacterium]
MDTRWIKEGLKAAGKSQADLAGALRIAPSGVSRLLSGQRKIKANELQTLCRYLECLPPEFSLWPEDTSQSGDRRIGNWTRYRPGGMREQGSLSPDLLNLPHVNKQGDRGASSQPTLALLDQDLPISGIALGGTPENPQPNTGDDRFYFNGLTIGYLRRPPGLYGAKGAFALYVMGDSMAPRHEAGDLIYIDPHRPVKEGDYVVIELHPGRESGSGTLADFDDGQFEAGPAFVKRLVKRS